MSVDENTDWGRWIVEELCRLGANQFCIGAGSRSTPLTVAAAENDKATTTVFVDERSAAFFALGYSKATGVPAVLITTSGTAMANAMPAVIEARRSKTPLILISADRPAELQESGANQTIDQVKLFGSQTLDYIGLPCPSSEVSPKYLLGRIAHAYHAAVGLPQGPVHINAPFRKPLGPSENVRQSPWKTERPWSNRLPISLGLTEESHACLQLFCGREKPGIIVVGALNDGHSIEHVKAIISASTWPAFVDISAGFQCSNSLPMTLLQSREGRQFLQHKPILHLGGTLVSTGAVELMNSTPERLHVSPEPTGGDPGEGNCTTIQTDFKSLIGLKWSKSADLRDFCHRMQSSIGEKLSRLSARSFSESGMVLKITEMLPDNMPSFWSNSMPVRDGNTIVNWAKGNRRIGTNRGASGIDGIISTASGFQEGLNKPCVLVIGDLATWHDLNAFLHVATSNQPLLIVVLNNGGGGIFSFLPIATATDAFETHFAAAHHIQFKNIIAACGVETIEVDSMTTFEKAFSKFIANPKPMAIEGRFTREENTKNHNNIMAVIDRTISEMTK